MLLWCPDSGWSDGVDEKTKTKGEVPCLTLP